MQYLNDFDSMIDSLASRPEPVKVAVVCPYDEHTCQAVEQALDHGIARFILFGEKEKIGVAPGPGVEIVDVPEGGDAAAAQAVAMAREGRADVIMKGLVNTDNLLRAVLNKETGVLPPGNVLSHVTASEIPGLGRLLCYSDAAVIPFPTEAQFEAMASNLVATCRSMGIATPRIAMVHCSEKTSPKFPVTIAYGELKAKAAAGVFGDVIIDGPMDVKTAVDPESGAIKGIDSPVGGRANALIFPDIEAANTFYKTVSWLGHGTNAGMLLGAKVPVVLPSRSDSARSKLCSLALAATHAGC